MPLLGTPIDLLNMPTGCPFAPRCDRAMKVCLTGMAKEVWVGRDHLSACWMNIKEGAEQGVIQTDENGKIIAIDLEGTLGVAAEGGDAQ